MEKFRQTDNLRAELGSFCHEREAVFQVHRRLRGATHLDEADSDAIVFGGHVKKFGRTMMNYIIDESDKRIDVDGIWLDTTNEKI